MATRIQFENVDDIGIFTKLTNKYCLHAHSSAANSYAILESVLGDNIPIVRCSIAGTRILGCLCVGNSHGLLVPSITTDQELQHLRNSLPDEISIQRVEERLSALGNVIACNDYVALIHPDVDKQTEEIIADVLNVEVFSALLNNGSFIGSNLALNNAGAMINPQVTTGIQDNLSSLLGIPMVAGTVNRGISIVGSGMVVNDWCAFVGNRTTATEIAVIESIFQISSNADDLDSMKNPLIDNMY